MIASGVLRGPRLGGVLALLTGLQILASIGTQAYLVTRLGAGTETDAFYAGATLSQMISVVTIDTLAVVLVPLLTALAADDLADTAWSLCVTATALFVAVAALGALVAPWLTRAIVPGFSAEAQGLTASLTRIHLFSLAGTACTVILTAVYQVQNRFVWPPVAALVAALAGWLFVYVTLDQRGVMAAAWGQVLAFSLPAALLLPGIGVPRRLVWCGRLLRDIVTRQRPLLWSRAYFVASAPIDRLLLSFLPPGSLVVFELVSRLFSATQRVITQGLVAPMLPHLSRVAQTGEWRAFKALYTRQAWVVTAATLAVVAVLELVSLGGLRWLADHQGAVIGSFSAAHLRQLAWLVVLLSGVLPCALVTQALSNAYYAQGNTVTPSRIAAVTFTAGAALRAAGFWIGGVEGLSVAMSLAAVAGTVWLALALRADTTQLVRAHDVPGADALHGLARG